MKIEKINDNQIRCTLNSQDLASRELKISELAYGTQKAKELFHDMIEQAGDEFGFTTDDMPLMIEAIPISLNCIVLIITKVDDPDELDTRFSRFTAGDDASEDNSGLPDLEELFGSKEETIDGLDGADLSEKEPEASDHDTVSGKAGSNFISFAEALKSMVEKISSDSGNSAKTSTDNPARKAANTDKGTVNNAEGTDHTDRDTDHEPTAPDRKHSHEWDDVLFPISEDDDAFAEDTSRNGGDTFAEDAFRNVGDAFAEDAFRNVDDVFAEDTARNVGDASRNFDDASKAADMTNESAEDDSLCEELPEYDDSDLESTDSDTEISDAGQVITHLSQVISQFISQAADNNMTADRAKGDNKDNDEASASSKPEPIHRIYSFASWEEAAAAARSLSTDYEGTSALYRDEKDAIYYLSLTGFPDEKNHFYAVSNELAEYGTKVHITCSTDAYLKEHCRLIIRENALGILKEY